MHDRATIHDEFCSPDRNVNNFSNIVWYSVHGSGASPFCSPLNDNELAFVSTLREHLLIQHVVIPTRHRGSDTPHTLDLIITSGRVQDAHF